MLLNDNFSMKPLFAAHNGRQQPCALLLPLAALAVLATISVGCGHRDQRGIADKRTNFGRFLPMTGDPVKYGLKAVRPYFRVASRPQVLRAIERACQNGQMGSSVQDPRTGAGYYVNCNPDNRQLLNGYISSNPRREPHSRSR